MTLDAVPSNNARKRVTAAGWLVAAGPGPEVCIATSTRLASAESTFILAHMARLPARVSILSGLEPPPLNEDGVGVAPSVFQRVLPAVWRRLGRPAISSAQDLAVARHLRRSGARALLAEFGPTAAQLVRPCRIAAVPLVAHFHGYDASVKRLIEHYGRYEELFAHAAAVIAVSRQMEQQLLDLGAPRERLHLIHYGVDTDRFQGADPAASPPRFVAVGRFVEKKAPELTILAFRKVLASVADARLEMIGDGPLLGPAQRLSAALELDRAISFPGRLDPPEVALRLSTARAFVQHCVTARDGDAEGTPNTLLEASATGLPIVATRHGGIPDIVAERKTGFLVPEEDADGMAERMILLAKNPRLAGQMGRAGRRHVVRNHSIEESIGRLWSVIESAIEVAVAP